MRAELASRIFLITNVAHDLNLGTISLDMVEKLSSCHVLELLSVTDITSELWTLILRMSLELSKGLPDDLGFTRLLIPASMRELAEVNTVSEYLVDLLHEIACSLAVRAADIILWSHVILTLLVNTASVFNLIVGNDVTMSINEFFVSDHEALGSTSLTEMNLAVLAEKLIAALAL